MASIIDKLTDQIPYFDGTFRRRFTAGGLLLLPLLIFFVPGTGLSLTRLQLGAKDIITSPVIAMGLVILIYAIGNLVEMFGEIFVARIAGNLVWALEVPLYLYSDKPRWVRYPVRALLWYPGFIFFFYWYFLKGLIGISDYKWKSLPESLEPEAQKSFEKLPSIVKRSLEEPFGNYAGIAFNFFRLSVPQNEQTWINRLEARNKDILAVIASLFLLFISSLVFENATLSPAADTAVVRQPIDLVFVGTIAAYAIAFLFLGYFLILRKSVIEMVEFWALRSPGSESTNVPAQ